jgi:hypothetical protein
VTAIPRASKITTSAKTLKRSIGALTDH